MLTKQLNPIAPTTLRAGSEVNCVITNQAQKVLIKNPRKTMLKIPRTKVNK